jgi:hypothetical protein
MDKGKAIHFGAFALIIAGIIGALMMFYAFKYAGEVKDGIAYFFTGSTREDPFCFSWTSCPSKEPPQEPILVSAPEPEPIPIEAEGMAPKPKPQEAPPEPTTEPTPLPTATPEPEPVLMPFPVEEPDPTPVVRIPPIQWHPKPLEDNSNPSPILSDQTPTPAPASTPTGDGGLPTQPPSPTPGPVRQFSEGDIVRWVSGGGWINEGQVQSAKLNPDTSRWVYDVLRADDSIWKNLEENRMTLVIPGVSRAYQHRIEGLPVRAYQLGTDIIVAEGIAEGGIQVPEGWMYDIRQANCEIYRTEVGVRTLLIESLSTPVDCDEPEPTPTPVPTATPTQVPTPTPTPDPPATPLPSEDESATPTPEHTQEPSEEEPTPTPTTEPEEEETEQEEGASEAEPEESTPEQGQANWESYTETITVERGNEGDYTFSNYTVDYLIDKGESEPQILRIRAGVIDEDEQDYAYAFIYTTDPDDVGVDCYNGYDTSVEDTWQQYRDENLTGAGCLGTLADASGPFEVTVWRAKPDGETYSWTLEVVNPDGQQVLVADIGGTIAGYENHSDWQGATIDAVGCGDLLEQPPGYTPCEPTEPEEDPSRKTVCSDEVGCPSVTGEVQVQESTQEEDSSEYRYSQLSATYFIKDTDDNQTITVGLISHPDSEKPYWYVSSAAADENHAEDTPADIRCTDIEQWQGGPGTKVWGELINEGSGQGAGCLGVADLAFNTSYTVEIRPLEEMAGANGWDVFIDGVYVADLMTQGADHYQAEFLGSRKEFDLGACGDLFEHPPGYTSCE